MDFSTMIALAMSAGSTLLAGAALINSNKIKQGEYAHQHYADVKRWYEKVLAALKSLQIEHENTGNVVKKKATMAELSALIDWGRLYFPNSHKGNRNADNPQMFRGDRVVILDLLILYYNIHNIGYNEDKDSFAEYDSLICNIHKSWMDEMTKYLSNSYKKVIVPYTLVDKENVLQFANIKNKKHKEIFESKDIVSAIEKRNDNSIKLEVIKEKKKFEEILDYFKNKKKKAKERDNENITVEKKDSNLEIGVKEIFEKNKVSGSTIYFNLKERDEKEEEKEK